MLYSGNIILENTTSIGGKNLHIVKRIDDFYVLLWSTRELISSQPEIATARSLVLYGVQGP